MYVVPLSPQKIIKVGPLPMPTTPCYNCLTKDWLRHGPAYKRGRPQPAHDHRHTPFLLKNCPYINDIPENSFVHSDFFRDKAEDK